MAVVDKNDEVGPVHPRLRTMAVGHFESKIVVLHVSADARVRLGDSTEFRFPIAVEDDPIDMAAVRGRFPTTPLGRVEADVRSGTYRIVSIQRHGNLSLTFARTRDRGDDTVASHVGDHLKHQLRWIGSALTNQITPIEPLAHDPFQLTEEMKLRFFTRITPLLQYQVGGEMVEDLRRPDVTGVRQIQIHGLPDDSRI